MEDLSQFVVAHVERGQCTCGRCINGGTEQPIADHTADLIFFEVAATNNPDLEEMRDLIKSNTKGEFANVDLFDGKEHSYIELGGWIGDQNLALQLMGLGSLLGLWKLLTPKTILGGIADNDLAMKMAGQGYVAIQHQH